METARPSPIILASMKMEHLALEHKDLEMHLLGAGTRLWHSRIMASNLSRAMLRRKVNSNLVLVQIAHHPHRQTPPTSRYSIAQLSSQAGRPPLLQVARLLDKV